VNIQSLEKPALFRRVRGFTARLADKRDGERTILSILSAMGAMPWFAVG
jgi:hypothetical protein